MRKCPVCQMIVDAKNECPICAATLTYEPVCDAEREHLLWNRYRWLYIAKCTWFSFLCCLIGFLKMIIARPQFHQIFWMAAALAAVSLAVSLFQRQIFRLLTGNTVRIMQLMRLPYSNTDSAVYPSFCFCCFDVITERTEVCLHGQTSVIFIS